MITFIPIPGKNFSLAETPVTQSQYEFLVLTTYGTHHRLNPNPSANFQPNHPVVNVSFKDITLLLRGTPYRLPTEEEWEYACRAGTTTDYYWGDDINIANKYAWFDQSELKPVKQLLPNAFGLYDMSGNVWEWTDSLYNDCGDRVSRGGSWRDIGHFCRSADRYRIIPGSRCRHLGFRVAMSHL